MNMVAFHPLRDQVLVEPIRDVERFDRKIGSLYTPTNPDKGPGSHLWEGRVLAVGPGDKLVNLGMVQGSPTDLHRFLNADQSPQACTVQVGDRVLFWRRTSAFHWDVTIDGKEYAVVLEEKHIAGIVDE